MAELAETPLMLVVDLAVRWVVRHVAIPNAVLRRIGVGLVGLVLLIGAELALVLRLRGLTISEYLASRDPVSGVAYAASLGLFAIVPALVARKAASKA